MNKIIALLLLVTLTYCVPTIDSDNTTTEKIEWDYTQARKEWLVIKEKHLAMKDSLPYEVIKSSLLSDMKVWCDKWDMPYETFAKQIEE
jgi:hypothetical protein